MSHKYLCNVLPGTGRLAAAGADGGGAKGARVADLGEGGGPGVKVLPRPAGRGLRWRVYSSAPRASASSTPRASRAACPRAPTRPSAVCAARERRRGPTSRAACVVPSRSRHGRARAAPAGVTPARDRFRVGGAPSARQRSSATVVRARRARGCAAASRNHRRTAGRIGA